MLTSVFGRITENTRCQRAFDIGAYYLEWWHEVPWIQDSVTSCSHWQHFVLWPLHFWSVKACGSTLLSRPVKRYVSQDNVRPRVAVIARTFLGIKNVLLLPWPERSPDLSPAENVWWITVNWLIIIRQSLNCRWTVAFCWSCLGSCIYTCHPISVRFNDRRYNRWYYCQRWLL